MEIFISRKTQVKLMEDLIVKKRSSFVAITGRRRVGKTFFVDQVYSQNYCFSASGI